MAASEPSIEHHGDCRHPRHVDFLRAYGAAMYKAALVTGAMVDIARVHAGVDYWDIIEDRMTMGALAQMLKRRESDVAGLDAVTESLPAITKLRNQLAHALPTLHGLHYRDPKTRAVTNFYYVEDLEAAERTLSEMWSMLSRVLHPQSSSPEG